MTDKYVPEPGDRVSWRHHRPNMGKVKGLVDYVLSDEEVAMVYVPPTTLQNGEGHNRRTRHRKTFDQLTLLERPES